jgi:hypothetical protein
MSINTVVVFYFFVLSLYKIPMLFFTVTRILFDINYIPSPSQKFLEPIIFALQNIILDGLKCLYVIMSLFRSSGYMLPLAGLNEA